MLLILLVQLWSADRAGPCHSWSSGWFVRLFYPYWISNISMFQWCRLPGGAARRRDQFPEPDALAAEGD